MIIHKLEINYESPRNAMVVAGGCKGCEIQPRFHNAHSTVNLSALILAKWQREGPLIAATLVVPVRCQLHPPPPRHAISLGEVLKYLPF